MEQSTGLGNKLRYLCIHNLEYLRENSTSEEVLEIVNSKNFKPLCREAFPCDKYISMNPGCLDSLHYFSEKFNLGIDISQDLIDKVEGEIDFSCENILGKVEDLIISHVDPDSGRITRVFNESCEAPIATSIKSWKKYLRSEDYDFCIFFDMNIFETSEEFLCGRMEHLKNLYQKYPDLDLIFEYWKYEGRGFPENSPDLAIFLDYISVEGERKIRPEGFCNLNYASPVLKFSLEDEVIIKGPGVSSSLEKRNIVKYCNWCNKKSARK